MLFLGFLLPFLGLNSILWLLLFGSIAVYFYLGVKKKQSFWKEKGIKHLKPKFILGNMEIFPSKSFSEKVQDMYNAFPEERYHGIYQFTQPALMIKDPDLIKEITVKEFDHFVNHQQFATVEADPFWNKNLVASRDQRWRDLRSTLSPAFTSSKMKIMFSLIDESARQFVEFFQKENGELLELEMRDVITRYTNDVIASTAFGLKCDSLKDRTNEFFMMGKDGSNIGGLRMLKFFVFSISPTLSKLFKVKIIPSNITNYFSKIIEDTVKARKEKNIVRPDMIQLLMEAQKERQQDSKTDKQEITTEDISSLAFLFFLAGFETVSIFITFTLYELAINPEIQNRLRKEIQSGPDEITYETLLGMKYLDMVTSETLRKWPGVFTDRQVSKDFTIQPKKPGEKALLLEKGLLCWLPMFGIHRDPKFYPDPEKFDPERFSEENKHKINPAVYLPFGAGPRSCIGSRFALLEGKLLIYHVLKNFEVVVVERTPVPMVLDKRRAHLTAKGGMWLGLKKIK